MPLMPSRRQEKVARVIKESVSDTIMNRLSDPRIKGFVTVTKVDISPDLRNATIYLSIMAESDKIRNRTFKAIVHAERHIQTILGHKMTSKYCPRLLFNEDAEFKKTMETLRLIDEAKKEFEENQDGFNEQPFEQDEPIEEDYEE